MLELIVETGPQAGQRFALTSRTVLGRGQFADLVVADLAVSRRHAQIEPDGSAWRLSDLESANGTKHNGKALQSPVLLGDGDRVEIGQTRLRVQLNLAETTEPTEQLLPKPVPNALLAAVEATMLASDVHLPLPQSFHPTVPPREVAAFLPGVERRQQVIVRLQFFQRMAALIAGSGVLESQLRDALTALADAFPLCRRMTVLTRESAQRPWRVLAQRVSTGDALDLELAQAMAHAASSTKRALIATSDTAPPPIAQALWSRMPAAAAAMPLIRADAELGALYLDAREDKDALALHDTEFLFTVAAQFAALLATGRGEGAASARDQDEAGLARRIQRQFLPTSTPRFDGYELADCYLPAQEVSGDLFDFLTLADGRVLLFLGEVGGKGFPAAMLMARVGAHLRSIAPRARNASAVLRQLEERLHPELAYGMFLTAIVAALDPERGGVDIASAGHSMPVLRRASNGVETLPVAASSAIGSGSGHFRDTHVDLAQGDGLLFFSSGLTDTRNAEDQPFGIDGACALLSAARSAGQAVEALCSALAGHRGEFGTAEDLTLIALWRR